MKKFITYQLFIEVTEFLTLTVGKLGEFDLPAGNYVYTGSAKANLEARIARHLSRDKSLSGTLIICSMPLACMSPKSPAHLKTNALAT